MCRRIAEIQLVSDVETAQHIRAFADVPLPIQDNSILEIRVKITLTLQAQTVLMPS